MTVTPIRTRVRSNRHEPAPPMDPERVAALEADIAWNAQQAVAWPEHAEFFTAEADRLRAQLNPANVRRAA